MGDKLARVYLRRTNAVSGSVLDLWKEDQDLEQVCIQCIGE